MNQSLCDRCFAPGACCRDLHLQGGRTNLDELGMEDAQAMLDGIRECDAPDDAPTLPFRIIRRQGEHWRWACTALDATGRCGRYDSRPQLCRIFEPASDPLCVHWRGAEAGAE